MMKKLVIMVMTIMLAFAGCSANTNTANTPTPVSTTVGKNLKIVTSFYPMYISTINVVGDIKNVTVENMTQPQTGCLHDYEITAADMKHLETADIFIINGAGMETFLDQVKSTYPNLKIIDTSKGIDLIKDDTGEENAHVWLSINNTQIQVNNIAQALSEADSKNAAAYKQNAKDYNAKLDALITETKDAFKNLSSKGIVTMHEAFPYYAKEFGLDIVAVITREPGTEPTPTELQETIAAIKASKVKAVFTEPQYSDAVAKTLASETGTKIYSLDPVVTHEADGDRDVYIKLMRQNKETIVEALK